MPERLFFHRRSLIKSRSKGFYVINLAIGVETPAKLKVATNVIFSQIWQYEAEERMMRSKSDQYVCTECNHFIILNCIPNNRMSQEDIHFSSFKRG
jgi:hypothetical protein